MDTQVILLKKIWKIGLVAIATGALVFAALFVNLRNVSACESWDEGEEYYEEDGCYEDEETCDSCGGSTNINNNVNKNVNVNKQEQNQENDQTVDITVTNTTEVESATVSSGKVPLKQPETGVGVLGFASMFSVAPIGYLLTRYGRGRIIKSRREENLARVGKDLVDTRGDKSLDA